MCSGEGHPCHTARCAEHTCGRTAQFYPSEPSRGQAALACGTIATSRLFLPSLFCCGNRMVFLLLSRDGLEAMYIEVFLNRTSFLDELHHSLRQGSGGSASPTPSAQEGAWCCLSALSPEGTWDREQLTHSLCSPAWGQICHGLEGVPLPSK